MRDRTRIGDRLVVVATLTGTLLTVCAAEARELRVGAVDLANSGAAEAQADFREGLAALHSFWYEVAEEAFRRAQEKDPGFALAYWGEAMSHYRALWAGYAESSGREALERLDTHAAERLERSGTEEERALVAAARELYSTAGGERAFSESLAEAHHRLPDSVEIASFYALSLQGLGSSYGRRSAEDWELIDRSGALLERLFRDHPEHPGVVHYLIHAYDDPERAPRALAAARRYADIAPDASHAQHMPSHIFIQTGDWDGVVASNRRAWEVSEIWVEQSGRSDSDKDFHALGWLHYGLLQSGDFTGAAEVRRILEDNGGSVSTRAAYLRRAVIEGEDWTADLDGVGSGDEADFVRGLAALRRGDLREARDAAHGLGGVLEETLDGAVAVAEGRVAAGLRSLRSATEREEETRLPSGPPDTPKPAPELLGEVLLELGRCAEAADVFARSLGRTPGRRLSVRGAAAADACRQ